MIKLKNHEQNYNMSSSRWHQGESSSPLISSLLGTLFIKIVHKIQYLFGNLLDLQVIFITKKEKTVHNT